jgi:DNA-binding CsgD family transcriptional regulator/Tfp pilus assembly protein PilF
MTPGALLEHLGSHTSLPEVTVRDLPLRQQNLYQLVVSSVSLLGVREQNFFCRLGVFVGSFSLEAASAVTDAEALGLDATATLIKLCEHSLVVAEPVSPPRYKLLETIRAVALEMLSDLDPFAEAEAETTLQQTQRRHLEYYLGFSREHASAEPQNKLTLFEREFPNSCLAIRWAATQNESLKELGLRLLVNTAWFWNVKGYIAEGLNYFNLYSVHRNYPAALLTKWFHGRAYFLVEAGHVSESLQFGHEALELAQSLENLTTCADISILLGYTYLKQCDFSKALEYYEKAAHLREQLGNSASLPILTNNRGSVYRQLGDTVRARSCFEEALKGARELGDVQAQAMYLGNVAITWMYEDKYYAIKLLEEALEFARQVDNQRETAMILQNLSELFYKTNQLDKAQALAQESLAIKKTLGDLYNIALILSNLGIYAQHVQDNDTALQYFRESQELFRKLGAPMREAGAKSLAARHWHDDPPKAFKVHSEAMQIILRDSLIDAEYMTVCLDALLDLEIKVGRLPEAAVLWGAIQKLAVYDREVMWSREGLGQLEQTLDKETFELAVERGKTINLNDLYQELRQRWTPANTSEQKISVQTQTHTDALSVRQLEVLKLVAQGYSSKKIAKTFGLSEPTVKYHLNSIYNKLGVNSRAEAVAQATQRHLL